MNLIFPIVLLDIQNIQNKAFITAVVLCHPVYKIVNFTTRYSGNTFLILASGFNTVPGPFSYDSQQGAAARQMESSHFGKACHFCWQSGALSKVVEHFNFTDAATQSGLLFV